MSDNQRLREFFKTDKVEEYFSDALKNAKRNRIVFDLSGTIPSDLYVQTYGFERCKPDKAPTDGKKSLFSLHYVINGAGYYEYDGEKIRIESNSIFIACR